MELKQWLEAFRALHRKAHEGKLTEEEQKVYLDGREELARALLSVQRVSLQPGQTPRQSVRVSRAIQVDIDAGADHLRAVTRDISVTGFAAMLEKTLELGQTVKYALRIAGSSGSAPITGKAHVIEMKSHGGRIRGSFALLGLSATEREQLELFVFDAVLDCLTV